jgi:hypothetical protein
MTGRAPVALAQRRNASVMPGHARGGAAESTSPRPAAASSAFFHTHQVGSTSVNSRSSGNHGSAGADASGCAAVI